MKGSKYINPEKEKVPVMVIYKQDGKIFLEMPDESNSFEVYGFLKIYMKKFESKMIEDMNLE